MGRHENRAARMGLGSAVLIGGNDLFRGNERVAAGLRRQILVCGAGVFTATGWPEMVDGT